MYENQPHVPRPLKDLGLIHAIYGTGPGKTSRAIGLAVRMAGAGGRVVFVQFMKSGDSSEVPILKQIPNITYLCHGALPFLLPKGPKQIHYDHAKKSMDWAFTYSKRDCCDLLICDEILDALYFKLIPLSDVLRLIREKRERTELVLTGADVPREIFEEAHYVTQLLQVKHPYYSGASARRGIEY